MAKIYGIEVVLLFLSNLGHQDLQQYLDVLILLLCMLLLKNLDRCVFLKLCGQLGGALFIIISCVWKRALLQSNRLNCS